MLTAKLKDGPGMTTCRKCCRAIYKRDADKQGNCCDCATPEKAEPEVANTKGSE